VATKSLTSAQKIYRTRSFIYFAAGRRKSG